MYLGPQPLAPVKPLDNSSPGNLEPHETLSQNHLAKLLLYSLLSETVMTSVCCRKLLSFEGICYPAVNKYTGVLLSSTLLVLRMLLGG